MRNLIAPLVHHRFAVVLAIGLLTVVAGYFAAQVRFDSSIEMWFMEDDPELVAYDRFSEHFGGDEIAIIGVTSGDALSRPALMTIDRLTQAAQMAPHVEAVRSLTTGTINQTPGEWSDAELRAIRTRAANSVQTRAWLVSEDAKTSAIIVEMAREGNTVEGKTALVGALREIVDREQQRAPETGFFLAGTPVLDDAFFRYNNRDMTLLFPITLGLVLVLGVVAFRRLSMGLLPLAIVIVAVIWTFGLMGLLGLKMSILSGALTPLLLAIGVADAVHVMTEYHRRLARGSDRHPAIIDSVTHLLRPCTFTSATTAAGLLSLLISPMRPVREFGMLAAIGVIFAYLLSMVLLPALLAMLRAPSPRHVHRASSGLLAALLTRIARPSMNKTRLIAGTGVVVVAISIWSITRLEVGVYALSWFPEDDPVVTDTLRADEDLGGSSSLEFLVTAPGGGLADPLTLNRLYEFERWLESNIPGATKALSIADLQRELPLPPDHPGSPAPGTKAMVDLQYQAFEDAHSRDLHRLVQPGYSLGRITSRVRLDQSTELVHQFETIEQKLQNDINHDGLQVEMTGFARLMGKMEDYLIASQIQSFALAFGIITVMMAGLLRSWRLGLFAMIPNLIPVILGLGVMPLLGITLNPGTIMIGAIALGLVVDDTVHLLVALRRQLSASTDLDTAIVATVQEAGRPIVITSLILMSGFAALTFGSFNPNIQFGAISALVIGLALFADILLLPAALRLIRPRLLGSA